MPLNHPHFRRLYDGGYAVALPTYYRKNHPDVDIHSFIDVYKRDGTKTLVQLIGHVTVDELDDNVLFMFRNATTKEQRDYVNTSHHDTPVVHSKIIPPTDYSTARSKPSPLTINPRSVWKNGDQYVVVIDYADNDIVSFVDFTTRQQTTMYDDDFLAMYTKTSTMVRQHDNPEISSPDGQITRVLQKKGPVLIRYEDGKPRLYYVDAVRHRAFVRLIADPVKRSTWWKNEEAVEPGGEWFFLTEVVQGFHLESPTMRQYVVARREMGYPVPRSVIIRLADTHRIARKFAETYLEESIPSHIKDEIFNYILEETGRMTDVTYLLRHTRAAFNPVINNLIYHTP